jgi:hypothetical protein
MNTPAQARLFSRKDVKRILYLRKIKNPFREITVTFTKKRNETVQLNETGEKYKNKRQNKGLFAQGKFFKNKVPVHMRTGMLS